MSQDLSYPLGRVQMRQDGSLAVPSGAIANVESGGTLSYNDVAVIGPSNPASKTAKVPLADARTAGGVFAWQNPEVGAIIVRRVTLDVTTAATAAGTVSVGEAANGTTSAANLIDTLDVNSATGTFDNIGSAGTNGKSTQKVASGAYVTASQASGDVTGLAGNAYIEYVLA
ncbi:MAG: hypothetical protein KGL39_41360 [Patescibacteria group bacterium]|nr:hypothetical protein [Patescibacteria group bacterium]